MSHIHDGKENRELFSCALCTFCSGNEMSLGKLFNEPFILKTLVGLNHLIL